MGIKQVNNTIAVSVLTLFLTKPLLYGKNKKVYGMGHARILTANRRRRSKLPRSSEQKKMGEEQKKERLNKF